MTIIDLIDIAGQYPYQCVAIFTGFPVLALVFGIVTGPERGGRAPWKYLYSLLVYLSAVPGMFSSVLTAYSLFFIKSNLLEVNLFVYILPVVSMVVTLVVIGKNVDLAQIPGFDRLMGLLALLGMTFLITLIIIKTRIFFFFGAGVGAFISILVFIFLMLKWGTYTLFRTKNEPKEKPPQFPY